MIADPADPASELVDIVDEDDQVVATVTRARMRAERLRHRTVAIVVTDGDGRVLVHRRSDDKDVWPGRWDVAAGGVVGTGERSDEAARRELAEELGVDIDLDEIVSVGRGSYEDDDVAEIAHVYRVVHPGPFRFADGEVVEARWVSRAELAELRASAFVPDSVALIDLDAVLDRT